MGRVNSNRAGDRAELIAALWLLEHGFEVFRNVSCSGPADLVAWKPGGWGVILIDVKSNDSANCITLKNGAKSMPVIISKHPSVHVLQVRDGAVVGFLRRNEDKEWERYWPDLEERI